MLLLWGFKTVYDLPATADRGKWGAYVSPWASRGWRAIYAESIQHYSQTEDQQETLDEMSRRPNTHKRSDTLPIDIHRDGREEAHRLARAKDEQGDLDAARDDDAVRHEGRSVKDEVVCGACDGEDVLCVATVRVEHVGHRGPA